MCPNESQPSFCKIMPLLTLIVPKQILSANVLESVHLLCFIDCNKQASDMVPNPTLLNEQACPLDCPLYSSRKSRPVCHITNLVLTRREFIIAGNYRFCLWRVNEPRLAPINIKKELGQCPAVGQ